MRNLYKILISTTLVLFAIPMVGQTNLDNWAKKCENMEAAKITVIKQKNPDTGKLIQDLMTISFDAGNQALYDELTEACKKDVDKAYQVIEERKQGKVIPEIYSFRNGNIDIQYMFSFPKEGSHKKDIDVTIIKKEKNTPK